MKKFIPLFVLFWVVMSYAQDDAVDKMQLRNGQVLLGKVEIVKTDVVNFKEKETGLSYETAKKDIRYILLSNGEVLTFEDQYKPENQDDKETTPQQPTVAQNDDGAPVGLIILATVGAVLVVLLLIGAAAN